ncbi:hypothetical protein FOA52_006847 [Chlamydomonas sp. UWO 241]|nr:hypothetical protein FOA52_006847 [Chlamydomonas sp. UWO 241]
MRVHASSISSAPSRSPERSSGTPPHEVQLVWRVPSRMPQPLSDVEARDLTNRIKACGSWEELHVLCDRHGRTFNHTHLSAAITHLAQLHAAALESAASAEQPAAAAAGRGSETTSTSYGVRGNGSSARAPPTSPAAPPPSSSPHHRSAAHNGPAAPPPPAGWGRELPPGAAALADRLLAAAEYQMSQLSARKVANILWAAARLGRRPRRAWTASVVAACDRLWGRFDPQHVANIAYALSLLGHHPGAAWLQGLLREATRTLPSMKPQEVANLCYALPALSARRRLDPQVLSALAARSLQLMPDFSGQELANTAWALSRLAEAAGQGAMLTGDGGGGDGHQSSSWHGADAGAAPERGSSGDGSGGGACWMAAALSAARQRMRARDLSPQGLSTVLLACARAGHAPPAELLRAACAYAGEAVGWRAAAGGGAAADGGAASEGSGSDSCSPSHEGQQQAQARPLGAPAQSDPQALSNLLLALSRLRHTPSPECMEAYEGAATELMRGALRAHHHHAAASPGTLGAQQQQQRGGRARGGSSGWRAPGEAAALQLRPQHLANVSWAMARLTWAPGPAFTATLLALTAAWAGRLQPLELTQVVGALSRMRVRAPREWLDVVCGQMAGSVGALDARGASVLLCGLAWQRYAPAPALLRALVRGLLQGPAGLSAAHPRTLAQLCHGLAAAGHRPPAAWSRTLRAALLARQDELSPLDAATLLVCLQTTALAAAAPPAPAHGAHVSGGGGGAAGGAPLAHDHELLAALARPLQAGSLGGVRSAVAARCCRALQQQQQQQQQPGVEHQPGGEASASSAAAAGMAAALARLEAHAASLAASGGAGGSDGWPGGPSPGAAGVMTIDGGPDADAALLWDVTEWAASVVLQR